MGKFGCLNGVVDREPAAAVSSRDSEMENALGRSRRRRLGTVEKVDRIGMIEQR
jgi:hypothetical protein